MDEDEDTTPSDWVPGANAGDAGICKNGAGESNLLALLRAAIAGIQVPESGKLGAARAGASDAADTSAAAGTSAAQQALSAEERAARDLLEAGPSWAASGMPNKRPSVQKLSSGELSLADYLGPGPSKRKK